MGIEQGLNVAKLKDMALAHWRTGGMNTLIKAAPFGTKPSSDPKWTAGYCVTFKYLVGRTPEEMADITGIKQGTKFLQGVEIFLISPLPKPDQFTLRGYTQLPGGVATNDPAYKAHDTYPPGLGAPQWELHGYPHGAMQPLATVKPGQRFTYPVSKLPQNPV